ncbi:MAG: BamA/TamA family outer membrane protein [Aphanocapsa sp. GSE-SYN-MK-11-07L]|nr:BamA/TamA family outer membrane protein [Aphanocapsa sp. GSE-SYN-MK-11-07L]
MPPPIEQPSLEQPLPEIEVPSLVVNQFSFIDNTVFSSSELASLLKGYLNRKLSSAELVDIRNKIAAYYADRGYINSGAAILTSDNLALNLEGANLAIRVIEGKLVNIDVTGSKRLSKYLKGRLGQSGAFNFKRLSKDLLFLQDDPVIDEISGTLEPTDLINTAALNIKVKPAQPYRIGMFIDNYRNPGVGTIERGVEFTALNPLTLGDKLNLTYINTNGSNLVALNYVIPITKQNTSLRFGYLYGQNAILEQPFDILDINSNAQVYSVGIRHPLLRQATPKTRSEFSLNLNFDRIESYDQLLGFEFPISRGANDLGQITLNVLRFSQTYEYRDFSQAAVIRSQFSLGLGGITGPEFNNGQFVAWRGDALWSHNLPLNLQMIAKAGLQVADRPLVGFEQFSIGGISTVRGYRQDVALGDNGIFGSTELRIPLFRGKSSALSLSPFFDIGYVWEDQPEFSSPSELLASTGLSLQYNFSNRLSANLTWGIPLITIQGEQNSLQEQGILFSLRWQLL